MLDEQTATPRQEETAIPWRGYLVRFALAMVAWAVVLTVLAGEIIPEITVFAALLIVGSVITSRGTGRAGPITLLVLGVLIVAMSAPFNLPDLAHPNSPVNFILGGVAGTAIPLAIVIGAIGTLRRWEARSGLMAWRGLIGVIAVGAVVSMIATAATTSDVAVEGDIEILAERVEFPEVVEVEAGATALFIDNRDPFRHTFTIEELGIDVELPASTARRVVVPDLAPGTYTFVCAVTGHEKMTGELVVSS